MTVLFAATAGAVACTIANDSGLMIPIVFVTTQIYASMWAAIPIESICGSRTREVPFIGGAGGSMLARTYNSTRLSFCRFSLCFRPSLHALQWKEDARMHFRCLNVPPDSLAAGEALTLASACPRVDGSLNG